MTTTTTYNPEPDAYWEAVSDYYEGACPACGSQIDYCQGHGEIGDPHGARILAEHDEGFHANCNPRGCDEHDE